MAKQIRELFIDDIDGSEATGTTRFAIDGDGFEIDLSDGNRDKLEKALAPFITKARAVRSDRHPMRRRARGTGSARSVDREKSAAIRAWAKAQGLPVSERGRIAQSVVDQYDATH